MLLFRGRPAPRLANAARRLAARRRKRRLGREPVGEVLNFRRYISKCFGLTLFEAPAIFLVLASLPGTVCCVPLLALLFVASAQRSSTVELTRNISMANNSIRGVRHSFCGSTPSHGWAGGGMGSTFAAASHVSI